MATATIQSVSDNHREFESKFGPMAAFDVTFTDGRKGQVVTKAEMVETKKAQFVALIGKETQFLLEDNGTWPDGNPKPLKVKLPAFGGGPVGGGGRPPRDEAAITRAVALKAAVTFCESSEPVSVVLATAEEFHDWLTKTAGAGGAAHGEGAARSPREAPAPVTTSAPVASTGAERETSARDAATPGGGGGPCLHPESNRKVTPSGKVRCGVCAELIG